MEEKVCPGCGVAVPADAVECPYCGAAIETDVVPVQNEPEPEPVKVQQKKSSWVPKVLVALLSIVVIVGVVIYQRNEQAAAAIRAAAEAEAQAKAEYLENIRDTQLLMLDGGADAENLCNLTKSVWYNTIYEKSDSETDKYTKNVIGFNSDFNTSLKSLYSDVTTKFTVSDIEANQTSVTRKIEELRNGPEEYEQLFETLEDMYDPYLDLTNLAISPAGSLQTYGDAFAECDSDFMKYYNRLDTQLEVLQE